MQIRKPGYFSVWPRPQKTPISESCRLRACKVSLAGSRFQVQVQGKTSRMSTRSSITSDSTLEQNPHAVIRSPRESLLPQISKDEASRLAYPPNVMPGQRDVVTPYGTMRVNEWGPTDGRKVLFVHGDTTPSPVWSKIAYGLTKKGCRVMTFGK